MKFATASNSSVRFCLQIARDRPPTSALQIDPQMSVVDRFRESEELGQLIETLRRVGRSALAFGVEHTPVIGRAAQLKRARVVLAPYRRVNSLKGVVWRAAAIPITVFGCLLYGFFFGLTAPWLTLPFLLPIVLLAALVIWALPDQRTAPTAPIEYLLPAFYVCMILFPEYLAITLPGLPWITMMRIIGLPIAGLFLVSLSVSKEFRKLVGESVTAIKSVWGFLLGFIVIQAITTFLSSHMFVSLQAVINSEIYWTVMFCLSTVIFRDIKQVERYWALFCAMAIPIVVLAFYEWPRQHIPWAAHIPSWLLPKDPSLHYILMPTFRPGTNYYRIKGTFFSPLALAEYLSLLTPMFLHFGFSRIRLVLRIACFAMIPVMFLAIQLTDSRLGMVGMFSTILLYGMIWSVVRWRSSPRDLVAAAIMYAYPIIFCMGIGLIFASHRVNNMLLGGNAQVGSSEARATQLGMAFRAVGNAPWGYGANQSGSAMGFADGDFITIDNYFITLILDYGVIGALCWYAAFIAAILTALRYCTSPVYAAYREAKLLAPLAVSLTSFLIIKWVHGQADNHAVYFLMLGMISALVYRIRTGAASASEAAAAARRIATDELRARRREPVHALG